MHPAPYKVAYPNRVADIKIDTHADKGDRDADADADAVPDLDADADADIYKIQVDVPLEAVTCSVRIFGI